MILTRDHEGAGPMVLEIDRQVDRGAAQDAELVRRVRSGDAHAFSDLYRAHARAVHAAVRDNVRDADTAADVVQETFTRALARIDSLRRPDRFRPWMLSIVVAPRFPSPLSAPVAVATRVTPN